MEVIDTSIPEVKIISPGIHRDLRGYFYESYNEKEFCQKVFDTHFVQDNQSMSKKGVIRGMHWQLPPYAQAKLVRCVRGKIFDVAVDIRKGSPTFMKYVCIELSEENNLQFFIPRGFAHGFVALTDNAIFQYKCDNYYNKESERSFRYDSLDIPWPEVGEALQSEKDFAGKTAAGLSDDDIFDYWNINHYKTDKI